MNWPIPSEKSHIDGKMSALFGSLSLFSAVMMVFVSDAIFFTVKLKQFYSCGIAAFLIFHAINTFFRVNENESYLNWNPFSKYEDNIGKYTNINCKSLLLSSMINLTLFLLKPSFSIIGKKAKKGLCHKRKRSTNSSSDKYLIQSTSVYKKPHFKWKNIDFDAESNALELAISVSLSKDLSTA